MASLTPIPWILILTLNLVGYWRSLSSTNLKEETTVGITLPGTGTNGAITGATCKNGAITGATGAGGFYITCWGS